MMGYPEVFAKKQIACERQKERNRKEWLRRAWASGNPFQSDYVIATQIEDKRVRYVNDGHMSGHLEAANSPDSPVHGGATGRSDGHLAGMTQSKWSGMSQAERERARDNSALTPQLKGLEGHRVEATTGSGETRRFIVGKSTGWAPIHLEIKKSNSFGGGTASKSYASVRSLGKVR